MAEPHRPNRDGEMKVPEFVIDSLEAEHRDHPSEEVAEAEAEEIAETESDEAAETESEIIADSEAEALVWPV